LKGVSKMKWISTKDRLPEKEYKEFKKKYPDDDFEVIVQIVGAELATTLIWDGESFRDNRDDAYYGVYEVAYWMPFPKVPKEINLMKINLNETIKVKLTPYGQDIYYHHMDNYDDFPNLHRDFKETDENGYSSFQLWDFMNIYGKYFFMGCRKTNNVIDPLEIVYEG